MHRQTADARLLVDTHPHFLNRAWTVHLTGSIHVPYTLIAATGHIFCCCLDQCRQPDQPQVPQSRPADDASRSRRFHSRPLRRKISPGLVRRWPRSSGPFCVRAGAVHVALLPHDDFPPTTTPQDRHAALGRESLILCAPEDDAALTRGPAASRRRASRGLQGRRPWQTGVVPDVHAHE
jgi:hypothetical protein